MKIICFILSVYVIMLAAKPCCSDSDCLALSKETISKQTPVQKECSGCSPFFACGSCVGFITGKAIVVSLPTLAEDAANEYTTYSQPRITKISSTIWLPPKLS